MLLWLDNRISALYLIHGFGLHLSDSLQQHAGMLIIRGLRHQFAAKGFDENGRDQLLNSSASDGIAGF